MTTSSADEIVVHPYPWTVRLVNLFGRIIYSVFGIVLLKLDKQQLKDDAVRQANVKRPDFGSTHWEKSFDVFLKPFNDPTTPTVCRFMWRRRITNTLISRLKLVELLQSRPEVTQVPIPGPFVVVGLPRTGTTLLYNLLAQDTRSKSPQGWEQAFPLPPIETATYHTDPRRSVAVRNWNFAQKFLLPSNILAIHEFSIEGPEEDTELLYKSFFDPIAAPIRYETKDYYEYMMSCDRRPVLRDVRTFMQALSYKNPVPEGGHWLVKSPFHIDQLDDYAETFPDAKFILTHRNLGNTIPSYCSLLAALSSLLMGEYKKKQLGRSTFEWICAVMNKAVKVRETMTPEEIKRKYFDVSYSELVKDPINMVKRIYEHFNLPFTDEFEERMRRYLKQNPQGKHGGHKYTLEEWGVSQEMIEGGLSHYLQYFKSYL